MDRIASVVEVSAVLVLLLLTRCSSGGDATVEQGESAEPPPAFRQCDTDDDCVAVPRVGCCHNGWKTSVRRGEGEAYEGSFVCPQARPLCPQYLVRDARVPRCDATEHLCELVAPQCAPASSN